MAWIPVTGWPSGLRVVPRAPASFRSNRLIRVREWSEEPGFPVVIRGEMSAKNTRLRLYF
jgi:hypothetical protein